MPSRRDRRDQSSESEDKGKRGRDRSRGGDRRREKSPAAKLDDAPAALAVGGCKDTSVKDILEGNYTLFSSNHGRPVYKKDTKAKGMDIQIYYWDARDGADMAGWWFGPSVGGDQVWAHFPGTKAPNPPDSEWLVPHDGTIDTTFRVTIRGGIKKGDKEEKADKKKQKEKEEEAAKSKKDKEKPKQKDKDKKRRSPSPAPPSDDSSPPAKKNKKNEDEQKKAATEAKEKDEQRKQLEVDIRAKREEDLRRLDDEMKFRNEEREKQSKTKKQEEDKMAAERLMKGKEEARQEEEMRKKREEIAKKQSEEANRLQEQRAVLTILFMLKRFANAMPEDFAFLKGEHDRIMAVELPFTGQQRDMLEAESARVQKHADAYVKCIEEQRKRFEEWQAEKKRAGTQ